MFSVISHHCERDRGKAGDGDEIGLEVLVGCFSLPAPCQTLRGQQEVGHVVLKVRQRSQYQIKRRSELDDVFASRDAMFRNHGVHDPRCGAE